MMEDEKKPICVPVLPEDCSLGVTKVKISSMYESQSESELLALCEPPVKVMKVESMEIETGAGEAEQNRKNGGNVAESSPSAKMSGRSKRRVKRLRNEPPNITGEDGPCGVHVLDFAEARATEMKNMVQAVSSKEGGKLTSQKLPRHMRRRAASHNVKRLPRRCREAAAREMEKSMADGSADKNKRSRKHRRNTCNLQSTYAQRQRIHKWLETHLWHTKRMKMCSKYGYQLSKHCSDKGVRAAYKSLTHGCLISDISYFSCVQVTGVQANVIKCLAPLFNSETGLTIAGKAFLTGGREGKSVLYRRGEYPQGAVGPVQFLWKALPPPDVAQQEQGIIADNEPTSLWVWSHPAMHKEVLSEINDCVAAFKTKEVSTDDENELIAVQDLGSDLVRFRLIGPRSHALLMEALKPVFDPEQAGDSEPSSDCMEVDPPPKGPDTPRWWRGTGQNSFYEHCRLLSGTHPTIKSVPSPAHFQRGTVLSMTVLDPRLSTPSHKLDMVSKYYPLGKNQLVNGSKEEKEEVKKPCMEDAQAAIESLPVGVAYSPLWNLYIKAVVSDSKESTQHINDLRSQHLTQLPSLKLDQKVAKIPVLLIQQTVGSASRRIPSHGSSTATCGWDIILPPNWGNEFWVSLIYHGARACGLDELKQCSMELQIQHFPDDFPDTVSGQAHCDEEKKHLLEKYESYPPDKRRNYGKFLIASPFEYPWGEILAVWSQESRLDRFCCLSQSSKRMKLENDTEELCQDFDESYPEDTGSEKLRKRPLVCEGSPLDTDPSTLSFYVLRSTEVLAALAQFVDHLFSKKYMKSAQVNLSHLQHSFKMALREFSIDEYLKTHCSALLGIKLQMYQRGTLSSHDVISVPSVSDFAPLVSCSRSRPHSGPKEEINPKGMTVVEGDSLTIGVSSLSSRRKAEVKEKRKLVGARLKKVAEEESDGDMPPWQAAATEDYHLHPVQPKRETFGYVTSAGYRHTKSLHSGVGFCTFAGFMEILSKSYSAPGVCEPLALVRGNGTQYWFVRIELL